MDAELRKALTDPALLIATYAAVVTTLQEWRERRRERRRIQLSVTLMQLLDPAGTKHADALVVTATNFGTSPVTITHVGFRHPGQSGRNVWMRNELPAKLDAHEERTLLTFELAAEALPDDVALRRYFVRDSLDQYWKTPWRNHRRLVRAMAERQRRLRATATAIGAGVPEPVNVKPAKSHEPRA